MAGLRGRTALVTGVSRRAGIGFAIAERLRADGAEVYIQGWSAHDDEQPWAEGPAIGEALSTATGFGIDQVDLGEPGAPELLVERAARQLGPIDIVVANHARSSRQSLADLTVDELDRSWAVNARASVMLVKGFADQHDDARPGGRVVLFTSGQHLGPMADELPYAISKGAIHQMTRSLADALADRGITVNTLNPGPTDTGWASEELTREVGRALPRGRWGTAAEAAAVVAWLVSDDAAPVTGQVIDAEGGFRRFGRD
ncbi:MAG: SDR family oxidoreductase [Acidimicrobiales bacterium]